jgi:hypothetical protein
MRIELALPAWDSLWFVRLGWVTRQHLVEAAADDPLKPATLPEVRDWLETLPLTGYAKVEAMPEVGPAIAAQEECEAGQDAHAPATEAYERKWL